MSKIMLFGFMICTVLLEPRAFADQSTSGGGKKVDESASNLVLRNASAMDLYFKQSPFLTVTVVPIAPSPGVCGDAQLEFRHGEWDWVEEASVSKKLIGSIGTPLQINMKDNASGYHSDTLEVWVLLPDSAVHCFFYVIWADSDGRQLIAFDGKNSPYEWVSQLFSTGPEYVGGNRLRTAMKVYRVSR